MCKAAGVILAQFSTEVKNGGSPLTHMLSWHSDNCTVQYRDKFTVGFYQVLYNILHQFNVDSVSGGKNPQLVELIAPANSRYKINA